MKNVKRVSLDKFTNLQTLTNNEMDNAQGGSSWYDWAVWGGSVAIGAAAAVALGPVAGVVAGAVFGAECLAMTDL